MAGNSQLPMYDIKNSSQKSRITAPTKSAAARSNQRLFINACISERVVGYGSFRIYE